MTPSTTADDEPPRRRSGVLPRRRAAGAATARRAAEGAAPETPVPVDPAEAEHEALVVPPPPSARPGRLRRRRRRLLKRRQDAIYHLGGLAFELYRRDLLGEDVMRRRASRVEALDDTVRLIDGRLETAAAARRERGPELPIGDEPVGDCVVCRTAFRAGARFCSNCGTPLAPPLEAAEHPTQVIAPPPPESP